MSTNVDSHGAKYFILDYDTLLMQFLHECRKAETF